VYMQECSQEYAVCVCVCICAKFHEEWCCVRSNWVRLSELTLRRRVSLRPFVRRSKTSFYIFTDLYAK